MVIDFSHQEYKACVLFRFGRRPMLLLSLALLVVTSSLAAFAPGFYTFVMLRFLMAFAGTGAWQTAFVLGKAKQLVYF